MKRIFRYLIGTTTLGLCFKKKKDFRLVDYCDIDYAIDRIERKRTSERKNRVYLICKLLFSIALDQAST